MTDTHRHPEAEPQDADVSVAEDVGTRAGMPRWVKVSLIAALVIVLLFVVAKVTGLGGDHGPVRHGGDDTPSSVVEEDSGHRPPVDHGP